MWLLQALLLAPCSREHCCCKQGRECASMRARVAGRLWSKCCESRAQVMGVHRHSTTLPLPPTHLQLGLQLCQLARALLHGSPVGGSLKRRPLGRQAGALLQLLQLCLELLHKLLASAAICRQARDACQRQ